MSKQIIKNLRKLNQAILDKGLTEEKLGATALILIIIFVGLSFVPSNKKQAIKNGSLQSSNLVVNMQGESWKSYKNDKYKFEFFYPPQLKQNEKTKRLVLDNALASLSYKSPYAKKERLDSNLLEVNIFPKDFYQYRLVDNSGGFVFRFDSEKKEWKTSLPDKNRQFLPRKAKTPIEAYLYTTSDVKCATERAIIPHPSYSHVVELANTRCGVNKASIDDTSLYIQIEQLLYSFNFQR